MAATEPVWDVLRKVALELPGAYEEQPWGSCAIKAGKKSFIFLGDNKKGWSCSFKLPQSAEMALDLPFCAPTHYGLGKSGWVTASFGKGDEAPFPLLETFLEESYRAVAPKRLIKELDGAAPAPKRKKVQKSGKALVVSEDPLRAARAVKALAESGLEVERCDHEGLRSLRFAPGLVVFDLGRKPWTGLKLAGEVWSAEEGPLLVFAGLRDRKSATRVLGAFPRAHTERGAPGSPEVVAAALALL